MFIRLNHPVKVNLSKSSLTTTNSGFLFGGNKRKIDIRNFGKYKFLTCQTVRKGNKGNEIKGYGGANPNKPNLSLQNCKMKVVKSK